MLRLDCNGCGCCNYDDGDNVEDNDNDNCDNDVDNHHPC